MSDAFIKPGVDTNARGVVKNIDIAAVFDPIATTAAAASLVLKSTPGSFYGANCTSTSAAGFLMLFDAASKPADGAVTPKKCWAVPAAGSIEAGYIVPVRMTVGITLAFSTTGPFTLTTSSGLAHISGEVL